MDLENRIERISEMSFSEIVGLVNEPNTPSGAHESIRQICTAIPMDRVERILDVGSNTGFATVELASSTKAQVVGVDINPGSVEYARQLAGRVGLSNAEFQVGNILALPFPNDSFDMVYCNNVTSFIADRDKAIAEYQRVLKPNGVLAIVPIYYIRTPPTELVERVSRAIEAPIEVRDIDQWFSAFESPDLRLYYRADFAYDDLSANTISAYAARVTAPERLPDLSEDDRAAAGERLAYFYSLFNENLQYCGFSVLIYRYRPPNTFPVLYTSRPRSSP